VKSPRSGRPKLAPLDVSGSGFTPREQVHITVKNAPGLKSPQELGYPVGKVGKLGKVSIQIPYSYNGIGPGCAFGCAFRIDSGKELRYKLGSVPGLKY